MSDSTKSRSELIAELAALRDRVRQLESESGKNSPAALSSTAPTRNTPSAAISGELSPQEELHLLRTLVDQIPAYIYAKDTKSRYIFNNAASISGLGASQASEVTGKIDFDFLSPKLAQLYYDDEQAVLASGHPIINKEEPYVDSTGRPGWLSTTKAPVSDASGNIIGLVGLSRDITELKQHQDSVAVSRDILQRIIQQLPVGVQLFDVNGLCIDLNDALMRIFGISRKEQLVGKYNLFGDSLAQKTGIQTAARQTLNGEIVHLPAVHLDFSHADPRFAHQREYAVLAVTFLPIKNSAGAVVQIVALNEDITERIGTEDNLRESEERYRRLVQLSPDGIMISDEETILFVNPAGAKIFGAASPDAIIGHKLERHVHPDFFEAVQQRHLLILQEGWQSPLVEEKFLRIDGRPVDVETSGILTTFQGKAVVQSVIRDISSRKLTEAELRFSDEILKQLPVAVIITDMDGIITRWMGTAEQIFGYSAAEAIGKSVGFIDHPEIVDALQVEIREAIAAGGKYSGEVRCVRKDGVEIPVEVNATVVADADGTPLGYISINTDVSARKEAEQALRVAETRYKTLVEQLPAIIYIVEFTNTDEPNRTIYISPQVETLLGFTPEEWVADPQLWIQQLHPADRGDVLAQIRHYDDAMRGLDIEYRALARDGSVVWFRNNSTMVAEEGERRLAHGIMLDITRQKQLEEQLQQAQKLEAVGQMAGGIAHNFNNVLTALIGHTELALDSLDEDHPVRFDLEGIRKSARRAADLTQQLLAFTRHQVARPQILDLNQLVTDINTMLRQLIDESVEFLVQPGSNLWFIKADSGQIEQVLVNLIVNARDAMPQGGKLMLNTGNISLGHGQHPEIPGGEYVRLSVADTGMGIPPEIQPHIFEPFFTTKEVGQGTGLGLSTCFGIVRQNKGHILFNSQPGAGTTFEIYLPRAQEKTVTVQPIKSLNLNMQTGTETVLLVEDATMVRQMSARVLRQQGFQVIEATNGEEALDILLQEPPPTPHLLITDLTMPRMSGDTLAAKVQELLPSIKILFISGHTNRTLDRMGILARQGAILPKPFTPDTLIKKVRKVLDE